MKHPCYAIILGLGLMLLALRSAALAISLDVLPASQSIGVGQAVSVSLVISGLSDMTAPSLSTFDLDVSFDATLLSLRTLDANGDGVMDSVRLDPHSQLDLRGRGGNPLAASLVGLGSLNLFGISLDTPANLDTLQAGNFTLATVTFDAVASGISSLALTVNVFGDAQGNPLATTVGTGSIQVTASAVPEPGTVALLGLGLLVLVCCGGYRRLLEA